MFYVKFFLTHSLEDLVTQSDNTLKAVEHYCEHFQIVISGFAQLHNLPHARSKYNIFCKSHQHSAKHYKRMLMNYIELKRIIM